MPPIRDSQRIPLRRKKTGLRGVSGDVGARGLKPFEVDKSPAAVRKRLALARDPEAAAKQSAVPGWTMKQGTAPDQQASLNPIKMGKLGLKVGGAVVGTPLKVAGIPMAAGAGAADALITGKGVKGAVKEVDKAVQLKQQKGFGTPIHHLGVPNEIAAPLGLVADVALNRGTLPRMAAGSAGKRILTKAGEKAAKRSGTATTTAALEQTYTPQQLKRLGSRLAGKRAQQKAYEKTVKAGEKAGLGEQEIQQQAGAAAKKAQKEKQRAVATGGSGISVNLAGREVPGVQRVTGQIGQPLQKLKRRVKESKFGRGLQESVGAVSPNKPPPGVSQAQWDEFTAAGRTGRGEATHGANEARLLANAMRRGEGKEAVQEAGRSTSRGYTKQAQTRYEARVKTQGRTIKPKYQGKPEGQPEPAPIPLTKKPAPAPSKLATGETPEPAGAGELFSSKEYSRLQEANAARRAKGLPPIKQTAPKSQAPSHAHGVVRLKPGERLYHVNERKPGGFSEVRGPDKTKRVEELTPKQLKERGIQVKPGHKAVDISHVKPETGKKIVALHEDIPKVAEQAISPTSGRSTPGRFFDKATGAYKSTIYFNPAFHLKQIAGDPFLGTLYQSAHKFAASTGRSARSLGALGKREEQILKAKTKAQRMKAATSGSKLTQEAVEGAKRGGTRSGFLARDIGQETLSTAEEEAARATKKGLAGRLGRGAKRAVLNREDLMRGATYTRARKQGLGPEAAAKQASKYHYDYGHLTGTERKLLRRVYPYYTFPARNVSHQVRQYVSKPGKYANYEAARREALQSVGLSKEDMPESAERSFAMPIPSGKGTARAVSFGHPGADIQAVAPKEALGRVIGSPNPLITAAGEIGFNKQLFTKKPISDPAKPLTAGPSVLKHLPKGVRKRLHIYTDYQEPKTGKKGVGVRKELAYGMNKLLVGPGGSLIRATSLAKTPQTTGTKILGAAGFPSVPIKKKIGTQEREINKAYDKLRPLRFEKGERGQRGLREDVQPTVRGRQLSRQIKNLEQRIVDLRVARGEKGVSGAPVSENEKYLRRIRKLEFTSKHPEIQEQEYLDRLKKIEREMKAKG